MIFFFKPGSLTIVMMAKKILLCFRQNRYFMLRKFVFLKLMHTKFIYIQICYTIFNFKNVDIDSNFLYGNYNHSPPECL